MHCEQRLDGIVSKCACIVSVITVAADIPRRRSYESLAAKSLANHRMKRVGSKTLIMMMTQGSIIRNNVFPADLTLAARMMGRSQVQFLQSELVSLSLSTLQSEGIFHNGRSQAVRFVFGINPPEQSLQGEGRFHLENSLLALRAHVSSQIFRKSARIA